MEFQNLCDLRTLLATAAAVKTPPKLFRDIQSDAPGILEQVAARLERTLRQERDQETLSQLELTRAALADLQSRLTLPQPAGFSLNPEQSAAFREVWQTLAAARRVKNRRLPPELKALPFRTPQPQPD